jgi:hypothetical protein
VFEIPANIMSASTKLIFFMIFLLSRFDSIESDLEKQSVSEASLGKNLRKAGLNEKEEE